MGMPRSTTMKLVYKGIHHQKRDMLSCDIKSKWASLKLNVSQESDSIIYRRKFVIKDPVILQSEYDSIEYKSLISNIHRCLTKNYLLIKDDRGKSPASILKFIKKLSQ